jgi:hypothetical protein
MNLKTHKTQQFYCHGVIIPEERMLNTGNS